MGTINYGTNKILRSIGYYNNSYDFVEEQKKWYMSEEFRDEQDNDECLEEDYAEEMARDDYYMFEQDDFKQVKYVLEKENFKYYKVEVTSGYYEGFYIDIDFEYLYFDNYEEKCEAQKELTRLHKALAYCIENFAMRVCYPWWCTSWEDTIEKSLNELKESVKKERERLKALPTDLTLSRMTREERKAKGFWW